VIIYGGGGHAKVIIDIVHKARRYQIAGLIDDDPAKRGEKLLGEEVIGTFADLRRLCDEATGLIIGIGDNRARCRVWERLQPLSISYFCAIHPTAVLAEEVEIGEGAVVMAGAIVNSCTRIGRHAILNTGSCIEHDCRVGDFAHIAPGAVLCGAVQVGNLSLVGVGAKVLPGVSIGREAIVGGGAVVTRDVADGMCVVGVPARPSAAGT